MLPRMLRSNRVVDLDWDRIVKGEVKMAGINDQTGAIEIGGWGDQVVGELPVNPPVVAPPGTQPQPVTALVKSTLAFPFKQSDIKYWVIKRKDGVVAKYIYTSSPYNAPGAGSGTTPATPQTPTSYYTSHFRDWCKHEPNPKNRPVVEEGDKRIFIADAQGLRASKFLFDYVLDNGDVLGASALDHTLTGDATLIAALKQYVMVKDPTLLKVEWPDRQDPPLQFEFWPHFTELVSGDIVTACQGGHGRSGTSLVCMMMCLIEDYTPYAAICHLRALHCPRAIESKVQHEYIGEFGAWLGRENDVDKVSEVKSFKDAFLDLTLEGAKKYQEWLREEKK